jgi:hypothetical protein
MPKGVAAQKRKKRGIDDIRTSTGPSHNLRPRGHQRLLVDYGDDIEMSDRVGGSDDAMKDETVNFEMKFRQEGGRLQVEMLVMMVTVMMVMMSKRNRGEAIILADP